MSNFKGLVNTWYSVEYHVAIKEYIHAKCKDLQNTKGKKPGTEEMYNIFWFGDKKNPLPA